MPLLVKRCSILVVKDGQCLAEAGAGPRLGGAGVTTLPGAEMSVEVEAAAEDAATIDEELGIEAGVPGQMAVGLSPGREEPFLEPGVLTSRRPTRDSWTSGCR